MRNRGSLSGDPGRNFDGAEFLGSAWPAGRGDESTMGKLRAAINLRKLLKEELAVEINRVQRQQLTEKLVAIEDIISQLLAMLLNDQRRALSRNNNWRSVLSCAIGVGLLGNRMMSGYGMERRSWSELILIALCIPLSGALENAGRHFWQGCFKLLGRQLKGLGRQLGMVNSLDYQDLQQIINGVIQIEKQLNKLKTGIDGLSDSQVFSMRGGSSEKAENLREGCPIVSGLVLLAEDLEEGLKGMLQEVAFEVKLAAKLKKVLRQVVLLQSLIKRAGSIGGLSEERRSRELAAVCQVIKNLCERLQQQWCDDPALEKLTKPTLPALPGLTSTGRLNNEASVFDYPWNY